MSQILNIYCWFCHCGMLLTLHQITWQTYNAVFTICKSRNNITYSYIVFQFQAKKFVQENMFLATSFAGGFFIGLAFWFLLPKSVYMQCVCVYNLENRFEVLTECNPLFSYLFVTKNIIITIYEVFFKERATLY